jgi:hypothetical protein
MNLKPINCKKNKHAINLAVLCQTHGGGGGAGGAGGGEVEGEGEGSGGV